MQIQCRPCCFTRKKTPSTLTPNVYPDDGDDNVGGGGTGGGGDDGGGDSFKSLYGFNGQLNFNPVSYDNDCFRALIADIGPDIMRAPCGSCIGFFDWDVDIPHLEDVFLLVRDVGCEISFVLDMINHTVEEQLDILETASDLGIPITKIELGNEYNVNDEGRAAFPSATAYGTACQPWIAAIREVYPQVEFGLVGGNHPGPNFSNWNATVLQLNPTANLIWHYHNPNQYVFNGVVDTDAIDAMIEQERNTIMAGVPSSKIWITEYNLKTDDVDIPDFANDYEMARAAAYIMQRMHEIGIPVILYHNIVGSKGAVFAGNSDCYILPPGEGIKAYIAGTKLGDMSQFGMLVGGGFTTSKKISVAKSLAVNTARMLIEVSTFSGSSSAFELYTSAGMKVQVNLRNEVSNSPVSLPTDMDVYKTKVKAILNKYHPELIAVENEEGNPAYYTGFTSSDYLAMLQVVITQAHKRGLKVTNAGLLMSPLHGIIYRDKLANEGITAANNYLTANVPSTLHSKITLGNDVDYEVLITLYNELIEAYAVMGLDYVNFHIYEPSYIPGLAIDSIATAGTAIHEFTKYLYNHTGKKVITNEIGQRNLNPDLTADILNKAIAESMDYIIWYDGDGPISVGLTDSTGLKRPTGDAFTSYMLNYNGA